MPEGTDLSKPRFATRGAAQRLQESSRTAGYYDALAWSALIGVAVLVCATFRDYGVPWDGQGEAVFGGLLLKFYQSWFRDQSAFDFVNFRFYGGGFELPAAILSRISPFAPYDTRHLFNALLGVAGLAATWRLARTLGGARTGLLAVLLLALNPAWYGHAFINARDVPFAAGMTACLVLSLRALDELPRITWRTRALFGLVLGLTVSVRIGGVLAFGFMLVPIVLWLVARARGGAAIGVVAREGLLIAGSLLTALVVAYAVMIVLWPWAAQAPLNPLRALLMFSKFPFDAMVLFEGRLVPARALPASYLPVQFAVRAPESLLIGVAGAVSLAVLAFRERRWAALVLLPRRNDRPLACSSAPWRPRANSRYIEYPLVRARAPRSRSPARSTGHCASGAALVGTQSLRVVTVVFAAAFPFFYFAVFRPVAYNGMRHFLFVIPPLTVLAALAFDRAFAAPSRAARVALAVGLALAGIAQTRVLVALHPNQYAYFNAFVGGTRGAQGLYEIDYWGTSLEEATNRLVQELQRCDEDPEPGEPPLKVYVCGNVWSAATFFPSWLVPVERVEQADFQIAISNFFCRHPKASRPIAQVTRSGAILSYVDDMRQSSLAGQQRANGRCATTVQRREKLAITAR